MAETQSSRPTIVCVDDDLLILCSLREQLMRGLNDACDIEIASSGEEALQLLHDLSAEGISVPLLICDHIMPGLRGAEVLRLAHQRHPDLLTILLTGQADVDAVSHAVNQANLFRLVIKPWHDRELIQTVTEALRRVEGDRKLALHTKALAETNRRLQESALLLQATMDATLDGLLVLDANGALVQINRQLVELWALPDSLTGPRAGLALLDFLRSQLLDPLAMPLDGRSGPVAPKVVELTDGRVVEYLSRAFILQGKHGGSVYSFRDVTERERSARLIRHQALHDSLSGLPNRLQFSEALDRALCDARLANDGLAVLFIDLDHFKRVNDTLGHDCGDQLLKQAAQRLTGCLRQGDLIARWGGDEFTVLAPKVRGAEEASDLARRIVEALGEPFVLNGMSLRISASVGLATYPADGDDGQVLVRRADMALYRVKQEGRDGFQLYRHSAFVDHCNDASLSIESDLRRAIEEGELLVHYQPQIDTRTNEIVGVEALARWNHPDHGWIDPNVFIPIAERTGAIVALGEWVLRKACRQAVVWRDLGFGQISVAVNLSAAQFDRSDLVSVVMRELASSGLAPGSLELEVTEAVALRHLSSSASTLSTLQNAGIRIALDDFGTGYASMAYLKKLPCDKLKIDRTFIEGLEPSGKDAAIIRALMTLAEGLGLTVVAEGVETQQVSQVLQRLGCWTMQGYLFCRPVGAAELTARWQQSLGIPERGLAAKGLASAL